MAKSAYSEQKLNNIAMKLTRRNHCVITGANDLEWLYSFRQFPVFMGICDHEKEKDCTADMNWYISKCSGCIQLNPLLSLDLLYPEQHEAGSVGGIWLEHHKKFAEFVTNYNVKNVFEIGAGHGILCKEVRGITPNIQWTILEPNISLLQDVEANVIEGYFNSSYCCTQFYDAVVHSHVLEHIYFPTEFIRHISRFLNIGKYHIFSLPNMKAQLQSFFTNCLNFEHTILLTETYVDYLLLTNGFCIIEKYHFYDHSIFYATIRNACSSEIKIPNLYNENKLLFKNFIFYHQKLIKDINKKIESSTIPIYLFGAHIFSQYLIEFGLNTKKIISIIDNAKYKEGKRLCGTELYVYSPKILKDKEQVNVILKAGAYNEEIKNDILKNINSKVTFWE